MIGNGVSRVTGKTEMGIRFGGQTDGNVRVFWEVEHFDFPVVNFVQLGKREVGLH
jgi:hypothetical protein